MVQEKATARRTRPRLTIERLMDKAEGYMNMQGLSATGAVKKAMPEELLAIPMEDLRILVESALVGRLSQRRSRERYRDTERRAEYVRRLTNDALGKINDAVQKKAEVLARVTYVMHGVQTPLLSMTLEDHVAKRLEADRTQKAARERRDFHAAAVTALKAAGVDRIADLSTAQILKLAEQAEAVWGEGK